MIWPFNQNDSSAQANALEAVEQLINQAVGYDPVAQRAIGALEGKVLAIESNLPPISFYISHHQHGLGLHAEYDGDPDTSLRGNAVAILALALNAGSRSSFAGSGVELRGDQQLLGDIQSILTSLDVDWQTALAQLVGDVPAHFISQSLQAATGWGGMAKSRAADVATGFVHEEARLTPTVDEVTQWGADIRHLRADTDRLQARVNQLQERFAEGRVS